jgi:hypothetical protein
VKEVGVVEEVGRHNLSYGDVISSQGPTMTHANDALSNNLERDSHEGQNGAVG